MMVSENGWFLLEENLLNLMLLGSLPIYVNPHVPLPHCIRQDGLSQDVGTVSINFESYPLAIKRGNWTSATKWMVLWDHNLSYFINGRFYVPCLITGGYFF